MSNEFKVGVKLHVDSTQYTAEFTKAGHTAQAFAAQVSGSASSAATSVQSVTGKLDGLGQAAANGNTAAAAIDKITQSGRQAAGALGAIPQPLTGAAAHFQAAQAGLAGVARQGDAVKTALSGGTPAAHALGAAAASASQQAAKAGGIAQAALGQTTISAKQTAAALRGVPAQFTDIITSIQGGQAPLTVFLQQGGQLKDMFGGAIPAAKALTGYVVGLINPFTAAAVVAGVLALAYHQGSQEADGYRAAILMSGNAAGTTVGQLTDMARAISEVTGTQGAAAAALTQMAGSGAVARENLQQFAQTAMGLEKYVGQPVKATVDHLEQLGKAPLQASIKLNEQYHHLTVAVYEQIRALEERGRKEEAGVAAQQAYMAAMEARKNAMVANLGYIERAWYGVTGAAKGAWDAMLNVGRGTTDEQNLAQLRENLARQQERNSTLGIKDGKATADLKEQIRLLEKKITLANDSAAATADEAKKTAALAEWGKVVNANKSKEKQQEEEILRIRNAGKAAGKEQVEIEREISAYKARVADKGAAGVAARELERQRSLLAELAGLSGDFYKEWESLNKQFQQGKITQEDLVRLQAVLLAKQPAMVAVAKEEQHLLEQRARAWQEIQRTQERAQQQALEAMQRSAKAAEQQVQRLQEEEAAASLAASANIPLAEAVERVALARAEDNYQKALGQAADGATLLALQKEIDARREIVGLVRGKETREGIKKTADEAEKELKRVTEQYEQGLTNAAMQGGKSLREYIHGMLRATAFRIGLDPVMKPLAGFLAGATGSGSAASGGGGVLGAVQAASNINTLWGTASQAISGGAAGASMASLGYANAVGMVGGDAIGALAAANGMWAGVATGAQAAAQSAIAANLAIEAGAAAALPAGTLAAAQGTAAGAAASGSTLSSALSAIPGWGWALAAVVALAAVFGKKPTPHTGGAASYSAAEGAQAINAQTLGTAAIRPDDKVQAMTSGLASSIVNMLDATAKTFGQEAGFKAATAFADDTSKDGAWGALVIEQMGKKLVDWQDSQTSRWAPKEFADGEAGMKQYLNAVANETIGVLQGMDLPAWAKRITAATATGTDNAEVALKALFENLAQYPNKLLEQFGTSRDQLAQLYAEGLATGDAYAAGQSVANSLVASIEASMLGNASGQIIDIVNQGIITPIIDAAVMGQNVAEALSQASIAKTIERAKATATAFAELFSNAEFQATLEQLRTTVGDALGTAGAALQYTPRYTAAIVDNTAATQAAAEAQRAATEAQREAEEAARRIAEERASIEQQWLQAIGASAELRRRELAAIDPTNRALQEMVWRIADMQTAAEAAATRVDSNYGVLQRSVDAEKQALADRWSTAKEGLAQQAELARESIGKINTIFGAIQSAIKSTEVQSEALDRARRASALATLQAALAQAKTGVRVDKLPGIEQALGVLSKPSDQLFGRFEDYVRSQDEAADAMRQLGDQASGQLSVAEMTLKATEDASKALEKQYQQDVAALDQTLAVWREQIDVSRGIDVSVLTVRDAVDRLAASILAGKQASSAVASASSLAAFTPEQIIGGVDYVRDAASRGDVMAVYQGAATAGLNVDQITAAINLAGYTVGADDVRNWIADQGLQALPEARKFATGAAFSGGGIVKRPTYFDMGQMGEAGDEGILPLRNVGGKLGVNAAGLIDSQAIVAAIAALQVQMELLIDAANATAFHTHAGQKATLELVDRGITVRTSATEPLDIAA
jgi:phage-related minor tail protein